MSVVTKRKLSNTAKLSVVKSVFVPILTYGHEFYVMTERALSQMQLEEIFFAKCSRHDTSRQSAQLRNWWSCECWAASPKREPSATLVWPCDQNSSGKIGEASPAGYTDWKAAQRSTKDQVEWPHLRSRFVPSWCRVSGTTRDWCLPWDISSRPRTAAPPRLSTEEKRAWKWMMVNKLFSKDS